MLKKELQQIGEWVYKSFEFVKEVKEFPYDLTQVALLFRETQGFLLIAETVIANTFNLNREKTIREIL